MVRQRLNYPALGNSAMSAGIERALQFATQGDELSNAPVNVLDVAASDLSTSAHGRSVVR